MTPLVSLTPLAIYRHRLLNAARAARDAKPDEFDIQSYCKPTCQTPGCVLGHYYARTDLQDAFDWQKHFPSWYTGDEIGKHFGISLEEQHELFGGSGCNSARTPVQAADYIEGFVIRKFPQWT